MRGLVHTLAAHMEACRTGSTGFIGELLGNAEFQVLLKDLVDETLHFNRVSERAACTREALLCSFPSAAITKYHKLDG